MIRTKAFSPEDCNMDPNPLDQPQQQPQPHVGASQLPDENYIEKLFPKCQPKTAQTRGANQRFRNKRTMKAADRQQQYKRQNRTKQQQQQQQHHQQHHQQQQHPEQQPCREIAPRRSLRSTSVEILATDRNHLPTSATSHELGQTNNNQYYNSSDSSDKDANLNGRNDLETVRRSKSSQLAFQASNSQVPEAPPYNRHKTRKYKASKNLQQQLKRSQSSYSKLFGSQPLPIDPSGRDHAPVADDKLPSPTPSQQVEDSEPTKRNRTNGATSKRGNLKDPLSGRAAEKGNRTNRGIVFAEPIASMNIEPEPEPQPNQTAIASDTTSSPTASSNRVNGESTANATAATAATPAPAPLKTRLHAQHGQVSAVNKAADAKVFKAKLERDEALIQVADTTNTDIHPAECSNTDQKPQKQFTEQTPEQYGEADIRETSARVDNEDDDRFINLFVYDNAPPRKQEDRDLDKTPLITLKKQQNRELISLENRPQRQQDLKTSSHQLLGADLGEEDLISNDTSIEELCSFGDNDADVVGVKIKANSRPWKRGPENDSVPSNKEPALDIAPATANKSTLKHHRSIGKLQTVDEKAEINADEENTEDDQHILDGSKAKQVELSETTMSKKGFVPPGFPQRVRPAPVVDSSAGNGSQISQTSPTHVPLSPVQASSDTQVQNNKAVEACQQASTKETLPCMQLDNLTEESQSAIERNLSEALSKVSLDLNAPTLRQLKLPNEASHFSAIRSTVTKTQSPSTDARSSIQFNTLSDIESGADDEQGPDSRTGSMKPQPTSKRLPDLAPSVVTRYTSPGSSSRVDDDATPTTRTALVFPRLDEGLSSEAESCDDEVDDDDDRAMEADVDADDDDDEDDDDDDDVDNGPTSKNATSVQKGVDPFQQQPQRPQNRLIGNLQQQATSGVQARVPDLKSLSHSSFGDFNHSDTLDQEDLKPLTNYATQNGQPNYWMGSIQQSTMSSQPTSSSRFQLNNNNNNSNSSSSSNNNINSNNNGNNVNLSRSNNYVNRDDVKTANRLSSDTDNETDRLLGSQRNEQLQKMVNSELASNHPNEQQATNNFAAKQGTNSREVLIEGVLFNVKYLGSTHTECEGRGEKEDRIHQAELAVHEVKFRNGEAHSPVEVQLFISTEKIMVLDDKHRKIMMDHSLRTISYIADIGDAIVLIVRKKSTSLDNNNDLGRPISKTSCHVFESNESHTITKSISQAFQVAYTELLKANGGGDGSNYLPKELDYQEVLNSQEMSMTELEMFARKDNQREVIVPKKKGEILGLSIVESGWGSVLPTAVIASLKQDGPAYRCKRLSIGDQILSINGISLVGLSLAECQKILRKTKNQSVARLSVVPCPITVEVKIKRPDTKYQLGFSVQHGVICSLLRGGIAERGGVRVGHRIISINGTTVVGVPHDKIVTLLASSVGEIRMKTCLTSLYRHMLGEEKNVSFV